jgi:nucleoside-diphosphate-sugar epimerase
MAAAAAMTGRQPVVVVTGSTGLLGSRTLLPLRALGFEVAGVSRRPSPDADFRHIAIDLRDARSAQSMLEDLRPTHVLHCAWDVTHGRFWHAPENADWVAATMLLARAAGRCGVRRFVALGSAAEYDWTGANDAPRRETDPTEPSTLYGAAKNATRAVLDPLCRALGMSFAWGRVFDVFGAGEASGRLVASLLSALRAGETFTCRYGQLVRDYMAAEDVGIAVAALVTSEVVGCVNIASGHSTSLGDLTTLIATRLGCLDLLTVGADPVVGAPLCMRADVTRLRREVGVLSQPDLLRWLV